MQMKFDVSVHQLFRSFLNQGGYFIVPFMLYIGCNII